MRRWFVLSDVEPGTILAEWRRPFDLWGFTGSHRALLFRSPRENWSGDDMPGDDRSGDDMSMDDRSGDDMSMDDRSGDDSRAGDDGGGSSGGDGDRENGSGGDRGTRIDLVFKPIDALRVRTSYRTLTIRAATVERAREVLPWASGGSPDVRLVELVDADGSVDHIACLATGYHEDRGAGWEPSPFAEDLSDGRAAPWRTRILGGGPDGDLKARYATIAELDAALREAALREAALRNATPANGGLTNAAPAQAGLTNAGLTHAGLTNAGLTNAGLTNVNPAGAAGSRGRFLYLSMVQISHAAAHAPTDPRAAAVAAFLTRAEAEADVAARSAGDGGADFRIERWVDVTAIDL